MSPLPQHGTPAGDATIEIRKLARRTGGDVQELQVLYALEGLLARLTRSQQGHDFVLKGGVLLAAYAARRPTKDLDLQANRMTSDADEVGARIREIARVEVADGVVFDPDSVETTLIRDDAVYPGVRVKLRAQLGIARLVVGIDVSFGDPIWPEPTVISVAITLSAPGGYAGERARQVASVANARSPRGRTARALGRDAARRSYLRRSGPWRRSDPRQVESVRAEMAYVLGDRSGAGPRHHRTTCSCPPAARRRTVSGR